MAANMYSQDEESQGKHLTDSCGLPKNRYTKEVAWLGRSKFFHPLKQGISGQGRWNRHVKGWFLKGLMGKERETKNAGQQKEKQEKAFVAEGIQIINTQNYPTEEKKNRSLPESFCPKNY